MKSYFSAEFFAANRQRLRQQIKDGIPIVITANGLLQKGAEIAFSFQQDASFWYLTGIELPDVILVMDGRKDYLIVPPREFVREAFDGAINFETLAKVSGVQEILTEKEGWSRLNETLKKSKQVAVLGANPAFVKQIGVYMSPVRRRLVQKIKRQNQALEIIDVRKNLARMRMVKQLSEIEAIQKAIDITIASIKDATEPAKLAKYKYEYELEAEIAYGFRNRGASGHAFEPIVAAGRNAATLHSTANNSPIRPSDLIVVDVGAEVSQYDADITRTICIGHPSSRQRAVYDAVLDVQNYAIGLQKSGSTIRGNEKLVEKFIGEKLRELKLIKTDKREDIRRYFPHGTSHFLGIDTHDAGDYDQLLESGVVLTVEPGIYIPEEQIGVRIEDDILITQKGCKNLSSGLSRELL